MIKFNSLVLAILFSCSFTIYSQTSVPASWDAAGAAPPNGWSVSGTSTYSNGNIATPAIKLNGTGQYVQVYLADEPGDVTYALKGQTANNAPFEGTFTIQESVDGTSWTDMRSLTDTQLSSSSFTTYTDTPSGLSRYIRWYFTDKVSGSNAALDDMEVAIPSAGPEQEIAVSDVNNESVVINGTYYTGAAASATVSDSFYIKNLGLTDALTISGINLSGTNASDFSITTQPSSVTALDSQLLIISFSPSAIGSYEATVTIDNNDTDENPYVFNILGFGDFLANEPGSQPSSLTFDMIKSFRLGLSFTGNGSDGYLVVRNDAAATFSAPTDGVAYLPGDMVGSAKVVYSGSNTSAVLNNIGANSDYNVAVFAYNGLDQYTNYQGAMSPLVGSQTSSGSMQSASEYNSVDVNASSFISDLSAVINPHTNIYYSDYDDKYIDIFASRDTTGGQKVVTCSYTSFEHIYTTPFTFSVFSREHTYPNSWFPTWGSDDLPEYSDFHNLYPAHQNEANVIRSNFPLGEVEGTPTDVFMDGTLGFNYNGDKVYEPRDSHKGDAARATFYMATAYHNVSGNDWSLPENISFIVPYGQDEDVLKKWHDQDPPSAREIARNDFLDSLQGNRNPFIDSVHYACYINFENMTWIENPTFPCVTPLGINKATSTLFKVYPNPTKDIVSITSSEKNQTNYSIYNMLGKKVLSGFFMGNKTIDLSSFSNGIYSIEITSKTERKTLKIVKH